MLYRKYRPWEFKKITEHIKGISVLKKEFERGISGSYLIVGKAGTGKTSVARIIVSSLFCPKKENDVPCGSCSSCKKIMRGLKKEMIEIDLNTKRGKELLFSSIENEEIKGFIIENSHILSEKEIEEIFQLYNKNFSKKFFVFTTENVNIFKKEFLTKLKIIKLNLECTGLIELLLEISSKESYNITEEAIQMIVNKTGGNITEAINLLERSFKIFPKSCTSEEIKKVLSVPEEKVIKSFYNTLKTGNRERILEWIEKSDEAGLDIIELLKKLEEYISEDILGKDMEFRIKISEAVSETAGIFQNFPRMYNSFYGQYFVTRLFPCGSGKLPKTSFLKEKFDFEEEDDEYENDPFFNKKNIEITEFGNFSKEEKEFFEQFEEKSKLKTDISIILKKWPEVLKEISRKNTPLGIGMKFSVPEKIINNELIVYFPPDSEFMYLRISKRTDEIKIIENVLYVFFLEKIKIKFRLLTVEEKMQKDFEI